MEWVVLLLSRIPYTGKHAPRPPSVAGQAIFTSIADDRDQMHDHRYIYCNDRFVGTHDLI
jgi:hypothetical protein